VLGAFALLAASVGGASTASALTSDATAPPSQSFGDVPVYGTSAQNITITASGGPVTFGGAPTIEPVGGAVDQADDYSVTSEDCSNNTIPTDGTCTVTVSFNPFAAGLRQATLSVLTASPAGEVRVALDGTGVPDATGTYYGLTQPQRALDTRSGGAPQVAAGATVSAQVANRFGIPATGVSAVVINLTAVKTASAGFLTAFPSGTTRPGTSSINFPAGATIANMVTVPVGADGKVSVYNNGGKVHLIVDVMGWYAKDDTVRAALGMGSQFLAVGSGDPVRIYDSRNDPVNSNAPLSNGQYQELTDVWGTPAAASSVKAYALTITAASPTSTGAFTGWAGCGAAVPATSNVNYVKGVTSPNMAIVPAGHFDDVTTCFAIKNSGSGTVHLIIDLVGYYVADDSAGMRFKPLTGPSPSRILDTRNGTGATAGKIAAKTSRRANATTTASSDSIYVVGNTTGVQPTASTWMTVWSGEAGVVPGVSTLNLVPGVNRAVSTYAPLAYDPATGELSYQVFNNAGSTHALFDASGTLDIYPGSTLVAGVGVKAGAARTADLTLAGRTISGAHSFGANLRSTTNHRR
jgi:hypothetical protein